jgi:hypothetical protein
MDEESTLKVGDMYLAAALHSYGAKLLKVDKTDKKRQKFIFCGRVPFIFYTDDNKLINKYNDPPLETIETKYIQKSLVYLPNFTDSIRSIKSAIYSE